MQNRMVFQLARKFTTERLSSKTKAQPMVSHPYFLAVHDTVDRAISKARLMCMSCCNVSINVPINRTSEYLQSSVVWSRVHYSRFMPSYTFYNINRLDGRNALKCVSTPPRGKQLTLVSLPTMKTAGKIYENIPTGWTDQSFRFCWSYNKQYPLRAIHSQLYIRHSKY